MGIIAVLTRVEEARANSRFKQIPLLVDINIWYRILKLMYGASYCDINTRKWMAQTPLIFGVWHAYKYCVECL